MSMRMIVAVDFDGVLSSKGEWPGVGEPNKELMKRLIKFQKAGHKVILWTCRAGEALENAVEQCREHGLEFDAVNDNLPEIVALYGVNSRKITADYYIDDKAVKVNFERGKQHE